MKNRNNTDEYNHLESPLDLAVQAILAEPTPESVIDRVNSRATNLNCLASSHDRPGILHRIWQAPSASYSSLAASIMLLVVGVVSLSMLVDPTTNQAFAQVIENIKQANTVQLIFIMKMGQSEEQKTHMVIKGNRARMEMFDGKSVTVVDYDKKQFLHLENLHMTAGINELDERAAKGLSNPLDQLRRLQPKNAEKIGNENLNGHLTYLYRTRSEALWGNGGMGPLNVWVDPTNGLPIKIEYHNPDPKSEIMIRYEDIVWNQPLDDKLFALDIPEGYEKTDSFQVMIAPKPAKPSPPLQSPNP